MITTQVTPTDIEVAAPDGVGLRARYWKRLAPRGMLIIAHGFGEHGGCYRHVAEAIGPALDVDIVSPDLRGHGRSPGRRGYVRAYDELLADLQAVIAWSARVRRGLPLYLLGHSNGGLLALRSALEPPAELAGIITSNPALRLATKVPPTKLAVGRILRRVAPGVTLSAKLQADLLTRDPEMQRGHKTDPLRHSRMSAPLFFGMLESGQHVSRVADQIQLPLLMILGSADPVIDPEHSRSVFETVRSEDKTLVIFPRMLHEPLNEIGREPVFAEIIRWLDTRLGTT